VILVDTSVWIDHFHRPDTALTRLLDSGSVRMHSAIVGELAMGNLTDRQSVLADLQTLSHGVVADPTEVLHLVETHHLHGRGIGYVDAQLLASAILSADVFWTRDKRVLAVTDALGVTFTR